MLSPYNQDDPGSGFTNVTMAGMKQEDSGTYQGEAKDSNGATIPYRKILLQDFGGWSTLLGTLGGIAFSVLSSVAFAFLVISMPIPVSVSEHRQLVNLLCGLVVAKGLLPSAVLVFLCSGRWLLYNLEIQAAAKLFEEKCTLAEGQTLNVSCPTNTNIYSNSQKAWQRLKDNGEVQTLAITEGSSQVQKGKYFLEDMPSEGMLQVRMTNLQVEDSGLYRCVILGPSDPIILFYPVRLVVTKTDRLSSPGLTVTPTNVTHVTRAPGISIVIPAACGLLSKTLVFIEDSEGVRGVTAERKGPRYLLQDDTQAKVVNVTMAALRHQDSGRYWCMRNSSGILYPLMGFLLEVSPASRTKGNTPLIKLPNILQSETVVATGPVPTSGFGGPFISQATAFTAGLLTLARPLPSPTSGSTRLTSVMGSSFSSTGLSTMGPGRATGSQTATASPSNTRASAAGPGSTSTKAAHLCTVGAPTMGMCPTSRTLLNHLFPSRYLDFYPMVLVGVLVLLSMLVMLIAVYSFWKKRHMGSVPMLLGKKESQKQLMSQGSHAGGETVTKRTPPSMCDVRIASSGLNKTGLLVHYQASLIPNFS
ncbi:hypothetical protein MJG53_017262 [Ovis ammon polii x Ovis aries]|uniref:Uncharacterized protein n=1 Tax=Ovis ammon polii x Ovis aries TaxID=2918886 RepID=A0ACB9U730_9CETA|nr:hypothetical protein MJG53_017262 [Ovis ammon polii x Ovis aries]